MTDAPRCDLPPERSPHPLQGSGRNWTGTERGGLNGGLLWETAVVAVSEHQGSGGHRGGVPEPGRGRSPTPRPLSPVALGPRGI